MIQLSIFIRRCFSWVSQGATERQTAEPGLICRIGPKSAHTGHNSRLPRDPDHNPHPFDGRSNF